MLEKRTKMSCIVAVCFAVNDGLHEWHVALESLVEAGRDDD